MENVSDIMTREVIAITPNASLIEAVNTLFKYNFNGLPVVNESGILVGIITEYDLVTKGSYIYLPTFLKFINEIQLYKKDKGLISDDLKRILNTKVKDVMNPEPLTIPEDMKLEEAARIFGEHHKVNPIPVLNNDGKMTGIISRSDLIKFFKAPNVVSLPSQAQDKREIDNNVEIFLKDLERQFVLVSKSRTHLWFIASIFFAIVGYFVAWAMILRVK